MEKPSHSNLMNRTLRKSQREKRQTKTVRDSRNTMIWKAPPKKQTGEINKSQKKIDECCK